MIAALQLLTTSRHEPFGALPPLLTWIVIMGAIYGFVRLLRDVAGGAQRAMATAPAGARWRLVVTGIVAAAAIVSIVDRMS